MKLWTILGHPIHQTMTDLPVALWALAFAGGWIALGTGSGGAWLATFWLLAGGLLFAAPVIATGLVDFLQIPREHPGKVEAIYLMMSAAIATASFAGELILLGAPRPPEPGSLFGVLALSTIGVIFLALTVWHGQELILRYGLGQLPPRRYLGPERRARPREPLAR